MKGRKRNEIQLIAPFKSYKGDKPYIFVSYSHSDINRVYPEIVRLRNLGYRIWYDEGIKPGDKISRQLADAIKKSFLFLVFLSQSAVESKHVLREVYLASEKEEMKVLPIKLERAVLSEDMKYYIGGIKSINKFEMTEEMYFQTIVEALPEDVLDKSYNKEIEQRQTKHEIHEDTVEPLETIEEGHREYKYHVYMTFRNLDDAGDPTYDSILAKKCFRFLSEKGLRVFHNIISIEKLDVEESEGAIKDALDSSQIMVVIGMSTENIISKKVRAEWERFNKFITDGVKPNGLIISYISGFDSINLPETLRKNEVIIHGVDSLEDLYRFITGTLGIEGEALSEDLQLNDLVGKGQIICLSRVRGEGPDRVIISPGEVVTVGRLADNDIVLNLRQVSKHHAEIRYSKKGLIVDDLYSTNGTRVNNKKIMSAKLKLGDLVKFDAVSYKVCLPSDENERQKAL
jgi:hypothetical protein